MDSFEVKNINYEFISYKHTHSFSLHNTLTGALEPCGLLVGYSDVSISCLDSHSDGTHSQAEDPLLTKWYNAKFFQICFDEETNASKSLPKGEYIFCRISFLVELFL